MNLYNIILRIDACKIAIALLVIIIVGISVWITVTVVSDNKPNIVVLKSLIIVSLIIAFFTFPHYSHNTTKKILADDNDTLINVESNTKQDDDTAREPGGYTYIKITLDEYRQMLKENKSFFLYIGRDSCPYCEVTKPIIDKWLEGESLCNIYYLSTQEMYEKMSDDNSSPEELKKAAEEYESFKNELGYQTVPCLRYYNTERVYKEYKTSHFSNYWGDTVTDMEKELMVIDAYQGISKFLNKWQGSVTAGTERVDAG